jgi:hypothetical protein
MQETFTFINGFFDVFDHHNINYFLFSHGFAIKEDFCELEIATELLKARLPLLKTLNIPVTTSLFTTLHSQKTAEKVGFREEFSIAYKILQQRFPNVDFSISNTLDCKLSSLKIIL